MVEKLYVTYNQVCTKINMVVPPGRPGAHEVPPCTMGLLSQFLCLWQVAEASIDTVLARGALPPLLHAHDSFCNFSTAYHAQPCHRTPG
jgi:hypothetical protein